MKSIRIKNFKLFSDIELKDLSRINVITGNNNVGKSAMLEAIYLYGYKGNLNSVKDVLENRGEGIRFRSPISDNQHNNEIERLLSLQHGRNLECFLNEPILIVADEGKEENSLSFQMVHYAIASELNPEGIEFRSRRILDNDDLDIYDDIHLGLLITYNDVKQLYGFDGGRRLNDKDTGCEYVKTSQILSDRNPSLFDKVALTPNEESLIDALHLIEPQIEAINFLKDDPQYSSYPSKEERVPFVVYADSTKRIRLSSMGDGINRILTIVLSLLNCQNGILLIDEFENGLHHSVQYKLWKLIMDLSERLNIQVFVTTHSNDTLRSLAKIIAERNTDDMSHVISCYYLKRLQSGDVKNYYYSAENLEYLVQEGEDIR